MIKKNGRRTRPKKSGILWKYINFAPLYKNARARARAEICVLREPWNQLRMPLGWENDQIKVQNDQIKSEMVQLTDPISRISRNHSYR